jgi:hypothetical protein
MLGLLSGRLELPGPMIVVRRRFQMGVRIHLASIAAVE